MTERMHTGSGLLPGMKKLIEVENNLKARMLQEGVNSKPKIVKQEPTIIPPTPEQLRKQLEERRKWVGKKSPYLGQY